MNNDEVLPHFDYDLIHLLGDSFGCIKANEEVVYKIMDIDDFYLALGCPADCTKNRISQEEFIWSKYHKDGANQSDCCLQARIIEYLNLNSETFKKKYGTAYKKWVGTCESRLINKTADCNNCKMHPMTRVITLNKVE